MSSGTYIVKVDWENNGNFTDANDDITSDVMHISYERGKDGELDTAPAGICEIRLKNIDGRYSPPNTSSPLSGNLLPRRRVKVSSTSPVAKDLWTGYISQIEPSPHPSEQTAYLYCVDGLDVLARAEVTSPLFEDKKSGYLIAEILALAEWTEGASWILGISKLDTETILGFTPSNIDAGQDTIPYGWWYQIAGRKAIKELEDSGLAFFYINGAGEACWEDRHHRLKSPHIDSQWTVNDVMADITYRYGDRNIRNEATAIFTPRTVGSLANLWTLREKPQIPAGEKAIWQAEFSNPAKDVINPAATTDYKANTKIDDSGDDKTGDLELSTTVFGQGARIEITNGASVPVYITLLKIRGKAITDQEKITRIAFDKTSQQSYQRRSHTLPGKFIHSGSTAQDFTNYVVSRYKDPQPVIAVKLNGGSDITGTILTQILTREISDRITVQCTKLGLNGAFFINKMKHNIELAGNIHTVEWILGRASDEEYWCLDASKLDTETKLAY